MSYFWIFLLLVPTINKEFIYKLNVYKKKTKKQVKKKTEKNFCVICWFRILLRLSMLTIHYTQRETDRKSASTEQKNLWQLPVY